MRDGDAFGLSGAATGVEQIGQGLGVQGHLGIVGIGLGQGRFDAREIDRGQGGRHRLGEVLGVRVTEPQGGTCVLEHKAQSRGGMNGIEGEVVGPGFENGQQGDEQAWGALEAHANAVAGLHAVLHEPVGQLIGCTVERRIAQTLVGKHQRRCFRRLCSLPFKALMHARRRHIGCRAVPRGKEVLALWLR